ncbi:hypothetical protein OQA88_4942 [Cercophora sp. LCS_1]
MAGPGGGPPRRSHTKSRKGCDACKRRHIRCDENFPQCRNCTKHKIRCPYNDIPVPEDRAGTPDKPDLQWTPEIVATIDQWQQTGVFPFPSLDIYPTPEPRNLTTDQLRLIHHVAYISYQMKEIGADDFTLWTRQIPKVIKIGATHSFVLQALLAFSAMHLAHLTDCPLVGNMGYEHRGKALNGLQEAIGNFSEENSDAVLAASLVLSWQATDWASWTQLMQGTSSVIQAMGSWADRSEFTDFIAESSTFPTAPPSPTPDHKPSQPSQEDVDAHDRTLQQLQKVEQYLKQRREDPKTFTRLINFFKGARKVSHTLRASQQFDRLQPLRTWMFYLPVMLLQQTGASPSTLVVIAHHYTVGLVIERLFPEIGAAYFGSMAIRPLERIANYLCNKAQTEHDVDLQTPNNLMCYPITMVHEFRYRMGWEQPPATPAFQLLEAPNLYPLRDTSPLTVPVSSASMFLPYTTINYSAEDLSLVTPDSAPTSAISPLQLSSPFTHSQYLGIPSPSYGGFSPASSTFGDFGEAASVVYSDHEEYGSYEGLPYDHFPTTPSMLSGPNNFGVGCVPPIQTVWA